MRWALLFLGVLAVLTVISVVTSNNDDGASDTTRPRVTIPDEPIADEDLAPVLLPPVSALGPSWIETQRDDTATEVTETPSDGCPPGPIGAGWLVRSEQQRTQNSSIVEGLSVTAGVRAEGVEPISLDDERIADCLRDSLAALLAEGSEVARGEEIVVGPIDPGAVVSHVRFTVTGDADRGGTFDFVLVQRDRLVSMGLLTGRADSAPTPLSAVAQALDAPLQAALPGLS